jgi:hypothetical protein
MVSLMRNSLLILTALLGSCAAVPPEESKAPAPANRAGVFLGTAELVHLLRGVSLYPFGTSGDEDTPYEHFHSDGSYNVSLGHGSRGGRFEVLDGQVCVLQFQQQCFRLMRDEQHWLWKVDPDGTRTRVEVVPR